MTAIPTRTLAIAIERFPIAGVFTIARGSRTEAVVVTASICDGRHTGRGECVPYARYGETPDGVAASIAGLEGDLAAGLTRAQLQMRLPPGAARNALDCALWDLEAKTLGRCAFEIAGLPAPQPVTTAYTISLAAPDVMAAAAAMAAARPLLKIKLGGLGDAERIAAVRAAAPASRLIVDANEAWTPELLGDLMDACLAARVEVIEQPLPAGRDDALRSIRRGVPVCADESVHDRASLAALRDRYDAVNIKLDKSGGLTEALALAQEARSLGFDLMIGCMLGSSLSMAPAALLVADARWVDLDAPLLLARDREVGIRYTGSLMHPPEADLWG